MILFTKYNIYAVENDGDRRKNPEKKKNRTKEKSIWLPSHIPVYSMEADYFLVTEGTENKLDLPWWSRGLN